MASVRAAGVTDAAEIAALTAQLGYEVAASAVAGRQSFTDPDAIVP